MRRASKLVPAPDQRKTLRELIGNLYLTWADERLDKLDRPGAEQKLDLALAAQPQNQEVIARLLKVWEGQVDKKPQLLGLYKTVLEERPGDKTLRRRVADLSYELGDLDEAIYHYLTIYEASPEEFKGTPLEERIVDNLDRLHRSYAIKKDYDQAIYLYRVLLSIDPRADPSGLNYYEYLKRAEKVAAGDVEGRIALAQFIEKSGLPQTMALELYRKVLGMVPDHEIATAAIDGYAMILIQEAQLNFNRSQFYLAKTLSNQVLRDFPDSAMAGEKALEIKGKSDIEIERDERASRERAKQVVDQGNLYNQQAMVFYRDIFDTQRSTQSPYASPKSDAMKYFQLASQAYEAAIRLDRSVINDPALNVGANLELVRNYIKFLSAPAPRVGLYARNRPFR
ncbi:hypothetical protein IIC65_04925 [Candidatus Sumerlaeota bacterium]|nr:hypothetical protein [Candidatus Sumerlaeota bacterium]